MLISIIFIHRNIVNELDQSQHKTCLQPNTSFRLYKFVYLIKCLINDKQNIIFLCLFTVFLGWLMAMDRAKAGMILCNIDPSLFCILQWKKRRGRRKQTTDLVEMLETINTDTIDTDTSNMTNKSTTNSLKKISYFYHHLSHLRKIGTVTKFHVPDPSSVIIGNVFFLFWYFHRKRRFTFDFPTKQEETI